MLIANPQDMNRQIFATPSDVNWILLAHRGGARLYSVAGIRGRLSVVEEFPNPEGRRQNHEIGTDSRGSRYSNVAGRSSNRGANASMPGSHQMKHGLDPHTEAVEHLTEVFAHELVGYLHDARTHQKFDKLILIAEPGFLGKLRKFLDKETSKCVVEAVNQNLIDLPEPDLEERIHQILYQSRKTA